MSSSYPRTSSVSCEDCGGELVQEAEMSMYVCQDCGTVVSPSVITGQERTQGGTPS